MVIADGVLPEIIKSDVTGIVELFLYSKFADNIKKIILFGSFAKNSYQPDSDIDVAVVVNHKPEKNQLAEYYLIADSIRRHADLLFCTEDQLLSGKYVYSEILREGITLYENI